ncbi:hypothetical protein EDE15_3248 [Edaphobacter aggregans]|uniref:Uncharacterized protein n=2 Tax=Edaphobacter aggregans TaxID=570835 RepID=A0A428MLK7_9BACT|nr:hypothetical protein EDE15_3248 [Edaphobacter aggregans]
MTSSTDIPASDQQPFVSAYAIKSNHPQKDSAVFVEELDSSLSDLAKYLKDKGYGDVSVSMTETATLPIDSSTIHVLINVVGPLIAKGIATGFAGKLGADIYDWLKNRFKDTSVTKPDK